MYLLQANYSFLVFLNFLKADRLCLNKDSFQTSPKYFLLRKLSISLLEKNQGIKHINLILTSI